MSCSLSGIIVDRTLLRRTLSQPAGQLHGRDRSLALQRGCLLLEEARVLLRGRERVVDLCRALGVMVSVDVVCWVKYLRAAGSRVAFSLVVEKKDNTQERIEGRRIEE
ncbi:hypothetical protein R1sor_002210 [Riccia sorocarpa]|uniref:Uncharacterized protein n=1 Tax=Riccia sorocarpa TaxID=122646 RepID=A0ABD3GYY3_9MARC